MGKDASAIYQSWPTRRACIATMKTQWIIIAIVVVLVLMALLLLSRDGEDFKPKSHASTNGYRLWNVADNYSSFNICDNSPPSSSGGNKVTLASPKSFKTYEGCKNHFKDDYGPASVDPIAAFA